MQDLLQGYNHIKVTQHVVMALNSIQTLHKNRTTCSRTSNICAIADDLMKNAPPDAISLATGLPSPRAFPITKMSIKLRDGTMLDLDEAMMAKAQQYSATSGITEYYELVKELVYKLHKPPCWDSTGNCRTAVQPTAGGTDAILQVLEIILNPGDTLLVEEATYAGPIATAKAMDLKLIPVAIDGHGMIPESLRQTLSSWDKDSEPGSTDKPKLLYVVPTGQNPTGTTLTLQRKLEIYQIAKEYNILIFEDDPYYLLTFEELVPTFLSLDTDGRVLRADSFSKSIAPGLRGGHLSGPAQIIQKITHRIGVSTHGTSPMSQCIILSMFREWGIDGFLQRTKKNSEFYSAQRDAMAIMADKWLKGLVEYSFPTSGMFFWMKIKGCDDAKTLIFEKAVPCGFIASAGEFFLPVDGQKSPYIRLSFSNETPEGFEKAFKRLAAVIRENVGIFS